MNRLAIGTGAVIAVLISAGCIHAAPPAEMPAAEKVLALQAKLPESAAEEKDLLETAHKAGIKGCLRWLYTDGKPSFSPAELTLGKDETPEKAEKDCRGLILSLRYQKGQMLGEAVSPPPGEIRLASPLKIDRKIRRTGRVPKTDQELVEFNIAAKESPAACFAWIYGKDNEPAKVMQGLAWADLGPDDGLQQCRQESSRVLSAQSLIGF